MKKYKLSCLDKLSKPGYDDFMINGKFLAIVWDTKNRHWYFFMTRELLSELSAHNHKYMLAIQYPNRKSFVEFILTNLEKNLNINDINYA